MPESVTLEIPLTDDVGAGAYLLIFVDDTAGVPLTPAISGRVPCRPKSAHDPRYGLSAYGVARHGRGVGSAGYGNGLYALHEYGRHEDVVRWTGGNLYGPVGTNQRRLTFEAVIYDKDGRASATGPPNVEVWINTSPRPPRDLVASSMASGRITFDFTISPSLASWTGVAR